MENFRFFSICDGCKKKMFFVAKRVIIIPIGGPGKRAVSRDFFCSSCINPLNKSLKIALKKQNEQNNVN